MARKWRQVYLNNNKKKKKKRKQLKSYVKICLEESVYKIYISKNTFLNVFGLFSKVF